MIELHVHFTYIHRLMYCSQLVYIGNHGDMTRAQRAYLYACWIARRMKSWTSVNARRVGSRRYTTMLVPFIGFYHTLASRRELP